jgi:hypothetical protein
MNKLSPQIDEVMEFQIHLIVKLFLEEIFLETGLYRSVWTIETNTFVPQ